MKPATLIENDGDYSTFLADILRKIGKRNARFMFDLNAMEAYCVREWVCSSCSQSQCHYLSACLIATCFN